MSVTKDQRYSWLELRIGQMGLVMVAVPLCFGIIFTVLLVILLNRADAEIDEEARSRELSQVLGLYSRNSFDAAACVAACAIQGNGAMGTRYKYLSKQRVELYDRARMLMWGHPSELVSLGQLKKVQDYSTRLLDVAMDSAEEGKEDAYHLSLLRDELQSSLAQLVKYSQSVDEQIKNTRSKGKTNTEQARRSLRWYIGLGVLVNLLISLSLSGYFGRRITKRISQVQDNAHRMVTKQGLNSVLVGADEIAELDEVLHNTARELAELARKERAVVDNAADAIFSIDESGKLSAVNPATCKICQRGREDLSGSPITTVLSPEESTAVHSRLSDIRNSGQASEFETSIETTAGLINMRWAVHWSDDDKMWFCVARDISVHKRLEQLKQEFMDMVSHDLKSPLTAIKASMTILESGCFGQLNDKGTRMLVRTESEIDRLVRLITDLLDSEKLSSGSLALELRASDVSAAIDSAISSVIGLADKKEIEIEKQVSTITCDMDRDRFVQVIVNLLSNAIKFSPPSSKITITAEASETTMRVCIIDRGRGIPATHRNRIFERFKQVERGDASQGGTGLGLAISKMLIEQHQGQIGFDSEAGVGTTFWLTLPLINSAASWDD